MAKHNRSIILRDSIPSGSPVSQDAFEIQDSPIPELSEGQVLLRPIAFSVDPVQRVFLSGAKDTMLPAHKSGNPITGFAVARVIESRRDGFTPGSLVEGLMDWSEYVVWSGSEDAFIRHVNSNIAKPSHALSIYGITGLIAYFGILEVGKIRAGEVVVISSAAGSVGSIAGQIAKIQGAKVIGLTSSKAKQDILTQKLGFDVALNYRANDFAEQLQAVAPTGPDVYFDSVGGELAQTIMKQMRRPARVVECGQISTYGEDEKAWTVNISPIHMNGLRFEGFQPMLFLGQWDEALGRLREWVEAGDVVPLETEMQGLEALPGALIALLDGRNVGKMVVIVEE